MKNPDELLSEGHRPAFLCIKWGKAFDATAVNILKRAALEHCSLDVRFVCLTDNADGFDSDIEAYDIPALSFYDDCPRIGIWPKVSLFHPDLQMHLDQVVFLDLDMLVVGSLDRFFEDPGADLRMMVAGKRWKTMDPSQPASTNSTVMAYRVAEHTNIFETFSENKETITQQYQLEQAYVGATAKSQTFLPMQWVQSFKYHLRRQYLVDLVLPPKRYSDEAKIVAFHGFPRPVDVAVKGNKWARPPRSGLWRPKWVIDYWKKYK